MSDPILDYLERFQGKIRAKSPHERRHARLIKAFEKKREEFGIVGRLFHEVGYKQHNGTWRHVDVLIYDAPRKIYLVEASVSTPTHNLDNAAGWSKVRNKLNRQLGCGHNYLSKILIDNVSCVAIYRAPMKKRFTFYYHFPVARVNDPTISHGTLLHGAAISYDNERSQTPSQCNREDHLRQSQ